MQHPVQCIATAQPGGEESSGSFLLAACGPKLLCVSLESGEIISEWGGVDEEQTSSAISTGDNDEERPVKKQKTAATTATTAADIIKLSVSPKQDYVLAVTADKNIRTFSLSSAGHLSKLSARCMPKRPCAIQVLPDNSTILCGDKFGDVYSLPLLPDPNWQPPKDDTENGDLSVRFKPSATDKTVHTQRNLKTLEAQQNQKIEAPKPKDSLNFEHELLLGHVSMLTDLSYVAVADENYEKSYIVTADRDEHIRFSRAPPQSYIIEGYCLGHTEFVSKLCFLPDHKLLVSGGGDSWLGLWDWTDFKLRRKIQLNKVFGASPAVSVLKTFTSNGQDFLFIGCERSSNLALIEVKDLTTREGLPSDMAFVPWSVVALDHPILDVALTDDLLLISFDAREGAKRRLRAYKLSAITPRGWKLASDGEMNKKLQRLNSSKAKANNPKDLDDLLYGIENLRKRDHHEEGVDGEE